MGFGDNHVFHSIRKAVATLLENARIAENIVDDILGHEKNTMTYGLNSSNEEVTIIGVDLAKNVFQLHGAAADGSVGFRKKLLRPQFARFMANHQAYEVAVEACPSAHHWVRELTR